MEQYTYVVNYNVMRVVLMHVFIIKMVLTRKILCAENLHINRALKETVTHLYQTKIDRGKYLKSFAVFNLPCYSVICCDFGTVVLALIIYQAPLS